MTRPGWRRIETEQAFRELFVDRLLAGDGLSFTIHADGRLSGTAGGRALSGTWWWEDGMFCRTGRIDGEDLDLDREVIEAHGLLMRYTRDEGRGRSAVVGPAA
ncbi:hypothetical protein [Tranquillimonas alkanivorans]|uniref:Uncharacterized protein n=1 Tax=Tranquillimonas alkanivorans TaxID=441119 RepID=A0A1I5LMN6_9RHOB|nr:hypothetical protein [Tranquillimonas alkanivorans]SFO98417.1 hypothetical protein SAMN04488047_101718 [Tranquillimonas alkanivorans]